MACCLTAPSHYLNQCWLINTGFVLFTWGQFHRKCSRYLTLIYHKITSRSQLHLPGANNLTQWSRVTHICISKLDHHWFTWWLVACLAPTCTTTNPTLLTFCLAPSHYLCNCWLVVNWTLRYKNFSKNLFKTWTSSLMKIYLEMSSAKWGPFCLCLSVLSLTKQMVLDSPSTLSHCVTLPCDSSMKCFHLMFTLKRSTSHKISTLYYNAVLS